MPTRTAEPPPGTILVVDDDRGLLRLVEKTLKREGYLTATATTGREALEWLGLNHADLLLLDLKLQDIEGKELINHLESVGRRTPFIVITGQGDERVAVDMMKRGALDYLVKDVRFQEFVPTVVKRALEKLAQDRKLAVAEEALRHSEALLATAQQIAQLGGYEIELGPAPRARWSDEMFRILGVVPGALEPLSDEFFDHHVHPGDRERVRATIEEGIREAHGWKFEYRIVRPDGEVRHVQSSSLAIPNGGQARKIVGTMLDITELRRLEQEILDISDREQRRIGHDLHDGLSQQLAGVEFMSQVLHQKLSGRPGLKPEAANAAEIARLVRESIAHTRDLARGLTPVVLESEGLMSALQELAAGTSRLFDVECVFHCATPVLIHDNAVATNLYRIAQEAINNALKHGKARRIGISLVESPDRVVLAVRDNGSGLPADAAHRRGMGLRIMHYRAGMIGGSLAVQRAPDGGTSVICSLQKTSTPLKP